MDDKKEMMKRIFREVIRRIISAKKIIIKGKIFENWILALNILNLKKICLKCIIELCIFSLFSIYTILHFKIFICSALYDFQWKSGTCCKSRLSLRPHNISEFDYWKKRKVNNNWINVVCIKLNVTRFLFSVATYNCNRWWKRRFHRPISVCL